VEAGFLYMGDQVRPEPALLSPLQFTCLLPRLQNYDVIHAGTAAAAYPFSFFRERFPARLVHDMHGHSSEMSLKLRHEEHKLKGSFRLLQALFIEEMTIHRADYHLVVSRPLLHRLLAHRVPVEKTLVLRNGVDVQLFRTGESPRGEVFTVCYAGDYQTWQGIDLLIEAGRLLPDRDVKFRFIGFRQTSNHLRWREKIMRILGPRAELVDRVPQRELIGLMHSADLLVLPRPYHQATRVAMPTKFAEYIALGKPVLVTDVDETARFVREHRCGLVSPPTASGLAQAILKARDLGRDRLKLMGERARRLAESTFAWEVICQEYYDFLTRVVN
jgi:glycosyltransferase involved in cell wall biosynthesis